MSGFSLFLTMRYSAHGRGGELGGRGKGGERGRTRGFRLVEQVGVEDVELVALDDLGRGVVGAAGEERGNASAVHRRVKGSGKGTYS